MKRRASTSDSKKIYRRRRGWLIAVVVVIALLVGASLYIGRYSRQMAEEMSERLLPMVAERTGLLVSLGEIEPGLTGRSYVRDIVVQSENGDRRHTIVRIPKVEILHEIDFRHRRLVFTGVRLHNPTFRVELYADGTTNLSDLVLHLGGSGPEGEGRTSGGGWLDQLAAATVYVRGGAFAVSDMGRFGSIGNDLVSLYDVQGNLSIDAGNRSLNVRGTAKQQASNGQLYLDVKLSRERQQALLRMKNFHLRKLTEVAPVMLRLSYKTVCNGRVQMIKHRDVPQWYVSLKTDIAPVSLIHERLAKEEIDDIRFGLEGQVTLDPEQRAVTTDELIVRLGQAPFHLLDSSLRMPKEGPFFLNTTVQARRVPLQQILDGLPPKLIPVIYGTRVNGALDMTASLTIDMENVQRSQFNVDGEVTGFEVTSAPPRCDVRRLNDPEFRHLARKRKLLQKTIVLGPSNRGFVPYRSVGHYLRGAVLTCEDGAFFRHNGFLPKHINESLRRDLRDRRFVRGASTITMQLVKNLFLSEEKTLSRKLQEAMLTWWIEQEVSKERMFEIYMNIIEWGPGIYGCGSASRYYFGRHPSRLAPIQAAWMASIISNPVRFSYMKHRGVSNGWRTNLAFIMNKMVMRGTITEEDFAAAEEANFTVPFVGMGNSNDNSSAASGE